MTPRGGGRVGSVPASEYVRSVRTRIGSEYLLLPGVSAVIREGDRFLLARHKDSGRWSLIGGGIEPGESPESAVQREVAEELGVHATVLGIVGAYGGPLLEHIYPNGDHVGYVTVAFRCSLSGADLALEHTELIETQWFSPAEARRLHRHAWIDRVLDDAAAPTVR